MKFKKGSIAFEWVYALIFLFALGLVYIVFNQAVTGHIYPITDLLVPDSAVEKADIISDNDRWMSFWTAIPFLLFLIVLLYLFVRGITKRNEDFYG